MLARGFIYYQKLAKTQKVSRGQALFRALLIAGIPTLIGISALGIFLPNVLEWPDHLLHASQTLTQKPPLWGFLPKHLLKISGKTFHAFVEGLTLPGLLNTAFLIMMLNTPRQWIK